MSKESIKSPLEPLSGLLSDLDRFLDPYRGKIFFAYPFGSVAKGQTARGSDLDLAVYFADRHPQYHRRLKVDLYMTLNRLLKKNDIDIVVLNTASNLMLLDEIVRQGIVLLDSDPVFREEFELRTLHRAMDFRDQRKAVMGV
jgi:predicted nucleotidyltransferase